MFYLHGEPNSNLGTRQHSAIPRASVSHSQARKQQLPCTQRVCTATVLPYTLGWLSAGAALYANSQLQAATQMLATEAFGNPHSRNPSSYRSAQLEEDARARVLEWLGADPDEYVLVWTR